jgi:hypothetical protein
LPCQIKWKYSKEWIGKKKKGRIKEELRKDEGTFQGRNG